MESQDPDYEDIKEPLSKHEEEDVDVSATVNRIAEASDFEKTLVKWFLYAKKKFAAEEPDEMVSSTQRSYHLMNYFFKCIQGHAYAGRSLHFRTHIRMTELCESAFNLKLSEGVSELERAFVTMSTYDFLEGLKRSILSPNTQKKFSKNFKALFLAIKATIKRATALGGAESKSTDTGLEEINGGLVQFIEFHGNVKSNQVALLALYLSVGYLAAEEVNASRTTDEPVPAPGVSADEPVPAPGVSADEPVPAPGVSADEPVPTPGVSADKSVPEPGVAADNGASASEISSNERQSSSAGNTDDDCLPFYWDLYLFLAYKYKIIPESHFGALCSKTINHHFTSNLAQSVILLSFAYKSKFWEHLYSIYGILKDNLRTHNTLFFITKFVKDSIRTYPDSSYRYLVLLSFISEVTLLSYSENPTLSPYEGYINKAFNYYHDSGMEEFEELLRSSDNFQSLNEHTDRIAKAWPRLGNLALSTIRVRMGCIGDILNTTFPPTNPQAQEQRIKARSGVQPRTGADEKARLDPKSNGDVPRSQGSTSLLPKENETGAEQKQGGEERLEPDGQKDETQCASKPKSRGKKKKKSKGKR